MVVSAGWLVVALACASVLSCNRASVRSPSAPANPVEDTSSRPLEAAPARLSNIVFYQGLLWARASSRLLVALDHKSARRYLPEEHVIDIHRTLDDRLWVLSVHQEDVRLWERRGNSFAPVVQMKRPNSPLLALGEDRGRPVILASEAVFYVDEGGTLQGTSLDVEVKPGLVHHIPFAVTSQGTAYAGTNSGEWGGVLYLLELESGKTTRLSSGAFTSIIPDPDDSSCVLAGVGLRHFLESGRLLRACGKKVTEIRFPPESRAAAGKRYPGDALSPFFPSKPRAADSNGRAGICSIDPDSCPWPNEPSDTRQEGLPVFGLSRTRGGYWLVSGNALFYVTKTKKQVVVMPFLERLGRTAIGWTPGAVVVASDVNWAASVSGYTPLVASTSLDDPSADDLVRYPWLSALANQTPEGNCWTEAGSDSRQAERAPTLRIVCLERDRAFGKDGGGWTSVRLHWRQETDRAWVAEVDGKPSAQVRFAIKGRHGFASHVGDEQTVSLRRLSEEEGKTARAEFAPLPKVEDICDLASRCRARAQSVEKVIPRPGDFPPADQEPLPKDLRGCQEALGRIRAHLKEMLRNSNAVVDPECVGPSASERG